MIKEKGGKIAKKRNEDQKIAFVFKFCVCTILVTITVK